MLSDMLEHRSSDQAGPSMGIVVTNSNLNPNVQVVTWLFLAITSLMLLFRFITRFFLKSGQRFGWEEALITTAYLAGVGESITFLLPSGRIFGKEINDISEEELIVGQKAQLSGELLYIISLGFSKLSICSSFITLSPSATHHRITFTISTAILIWMLISLFGTGFQCGIHGPWDTDPVQCSNRLAFARFVAITNIITDAALIALPVAIIYPLHMALKTRAIVISFYMCRVVVIAATICQLIYMPLLFGGNFTLRAFPYYICTQVVLCTSISAACVAYFWPFFRSLRTGLMSGDNRAFRSEYSLSRLTTRGNQKTLPSSLATNSTRNRDPAHYINITADDAARPDFRSQDQNGASEEKPYMENW
ncbi:hypothetical protein DSL72_006746 [Monilinia vaccinii-corymbosi]|uniref:Rhodopsin domain-containing protein n=1 Tax=Monilinia vaccinii-corymbosi TaxID=61207 RepID=A0A8A3PPC0_9HELO|nr:hypothetical protein DSL72_006746 [Monilinia vaccinii-corymbosi]